MRFAKRVFVPSSTCKTMQQEVVVPVYKKSGATQNFFASILFLGKHDLESLLFMTMHIVQEGSHRSQQSDI